MLMISTAHRFPPTVRALCATVLLFAIVPVSTGCSHHYIYHPDNVPLVAERELFPAPSGDNDGETVEREVEKIQVIRDQHRKNVANINGISPSFSTPTAEMLEQLAYGESIPDVHGVVVSVSTVEEAFLSYSLPGAAIGAGLGALVSLLVTQDSSFEEGGLTPLAFGAILTLGLGLEGLLLGSVVGLAATGGYTDLRLDPSR